MRIPREAMTPALQAALRTFVGDGAWHLRPGADAPVAPDRARELLRAHSGRSVHAVLYFLGLLVLAFGASFRENEQHTIARNAQDIAEGMPDLVTDPGNASTWILLAAGVLLTLAVILSIWQASVKPHGSAPTAEFLASALDRLHLAPVQRRYGRALVNVYGGEGQTPSESSLETLALLRRLAEEEERLLALAAVMEGAPPQDVADEVASLRSRLQAARDPAAREALSQSLALAERRLPAAERASALRERLDAHASLLDQASRTAAESIGGRRAELDDRRGGGMDDLRANVAALGQEVVALEAAVQEMRAL